MLFGGFLSLLHSAYSAAQRMAQLSLNFFYIYNNLKIYFLIFIDRTYLRITEQDFSNLPIDVSLLSLIFKYMYV